MGLFQPNKEPKVEESALITNWHRPYYYSNELEERNNTENTEHTKKNIQQ
jgi:hypothetical protein